MKKTKVLAAIIVAGITITGITTWSTFNKTNRKIISAVPKNTEENELNHQQKQEIRYVIYKNGKDEIKKTKGNIDNIKNDSEKTASENTNIKYIYLGEHSNKNKENIALEETINNPNVETSKNNSVVNVINNSNEDANNSTKVLSSIDRMNKVKEIIDIINIYNSDSKTDNKTDVAKEYALDTKEENNNTNSITEENDKPTETVEKAKEVIQNTKGKPVKQRPSFIVVDPSKTNSGNGKSLVKPTDGKSNTTPEAKSDDNTKSENNSSTDINTSKENNKNATTQNEDKTKVPTVDDAPVLIADETTTLPYGSHWKLSDSNVKAYDKIDGDLHVRVAHIDVRAKVPGTYHVIVEAKNSREKITRKTITVNILPGAPTIKAHDVTITQGTEFTDSLVRLRVEDCNRKNLINVTKREGDVDTNKVGTYPLIYTVTDDYGLSCTKTVIVTVKAKEVKNSNKNLETSNNTINDAVSQK